MKNNIINYFALIVLILFIINNLFFKNLKIDGLLYKIFIIGLIIINILGNILIFMPLEYFLIELFKVKKFLINLILSFIIIILIKLSQYIFKIGVLDIDDILLCTFGKMLFYTIYTREKDN